MPKQVQYSAKKTSQHEERPKQVQHSAKGASKRSGSPLDTVSESEGKAYIKSFVDNHGYEYALGDKLGKGGYAFVQEGFKLVDGKMSAPVAIKFMNKDGNLDTKTAFEKEVAVFKRIQGGGDCNDYVIKLLDHGETKDHWVMIFEKAENGDLDSFLKKQFKAQKGHLCERVARTLFRSMLEGVAYCHSKNVLIRDSKPENMMMGKHMNSIKLIDFGLSECLEDPDQKVTGRLGSPGYKAPEVLRNEPHGLKADIFQLGIILFKVCSGNKKTLPFSKAALGNGRHGDMNYNRLCTKPADFWKRLEKRNFLFSDPLKALLSAMLADSPADRPSAKDLLSADWVTMDD